MQLRRNCSAGHLGAFTCFIVAIALQPASAQIREIADRSGALPMRNHDIVAEDYFSLGYMTECAAAPNGKHIAYVESRWHEDSDGRNSDVWVVDKSNDSVRRLTFDLAKDHDPQWSADSGHVYFLSARELAREEKPPLDGTTQVWRVAVDGSGLMPVTRLKDGVSSYKLSRDGRSLFYTVQNEVVDDPWKEMREKHSKLQYGHGVTKLSQLWKLDLETWRTEKLVDEKRVIGDFSVSPDGSRIAMLTTPTPELITNEGRSRVDVFSIKTATTVSLPDRLWRDNAPSPYGWLESLAWSDDGEALAFGVSFDGYPSEVFVAELDASHGDAPENLDGKITKLARKGELTLKPDHGLHWGHGSRDLYVLGESRARARVYAISSVRNGKQGDTFALTPGDVCVDQFDLLGDNEIAAILSRLDHPTDLYAVPAKESNKLTDYQRITTINPQVDTWKLPAIELVQWTSEDGTTVEGILELPPDHAPGKALPMIVELHGGPTAASTYTMRFWIYGRTLMAAKGYALFSPNYRGSTGYGDQFMTDLIGHKNDRDVADILAGVDAMVDRGIADPERLGVMGWSNGGYLTNCLITRTNRFQAASSGAGVLDAAMQWETEDTPGHVINFQRGLPWEVPDSMRRASPLYSLHKVTTPTLIHVGENDPRCPPGHSRGLYRALHEYLNVPTELVVYPGEGHGLTKYSHRKAKMEWDHKWFEKHLLKKETSIP